jgi:hypothetical protein
MSLETMTAVYKAFAADNADAIERIRTGDRNLAHYTSAENGLRILDSQTFWLRNTKCMNDYSEVRHGKDLVVRTLIGDDRQIISRLQLLLDKCSSTAFATFANSFGPWLDNNSDIFVGCLSEHLPADIRGRLSMWRAYGSNNGGVCFVFDSTPFMAETDILKAFSLPVSYYTDEEFKSVLNGIIDNLTLMSDALCVVPIDDLIRTLTLLFVFRALALKHPGFIEESEWRIVLLPDWGIGKAIVHEVTSINGVPQTIHKIPLKNDPQQGLHGADIPSLLAKVIIGPSEFPYVVWDAYVRKLTAMGVENAADKVVMSGIPLRAVR